MTERQKPSDHGRVLGAALAGLADELAPLHPDVGERCKSCAFRAGTLPNAMAGTLVEAMNCILQIDENGFWCHHGVERGGPTSLCAGYVLATRAEFRQVQAAIAGAYEKLVSMETGQNVKIHPAKEKGAV